MNSSVRLVVLLMVSLLALGMGSRAFAGAAANHLVLGAAVPITRPQDGRFILVWGHADPDNANDLIACGERDTPDNNHFSAVFASTDGGKTWRRTFIDTSTPWVSEDSCAFGNDGDAYFATGASYVHNGTMHHESGSLHVFRSSDRGLTWQGPAVRGFVDWTSIAVDWTQGPRRGYVYVFGNATSVVRGKWSPFRPILRTSRDGGVTFGDPVSPHPVGYKYLSGFAGGSIVLSDGTALVSYAVQRSDHHIAGTLGRHSTIEVMTSSDGGKSVQRRALLADAGGGTAWPSAPVEDRSQGPHRGRLYVAWNEEDQTTGRIVLGTSDDRGYHWNVRTVLDGPVSRWEGACDAQPPGKPDLSVPKLALNRDGILGISWSENSGHAMRFAISRDGGASFEPSVQLGGCSGNQERDIAYDLFAVPFSEDEVTEVQAIIANKPRTRTLPNFNKLGMSIRIQGESADAPELTADASGAFHAFWEQPGEGLSLWTRTIWVSKQLQPTARQRGERIQKTTEHVSVVAQQQPAAAGDDITSSVAFEFSNLRYDAASKTFSADVTLLNKGHQLIVGSVRLEGYGIHSNYGHAVPVHPTSISQDGNPVWDVSAVIPPGGLMPEMASKPYRMAFKVEKFHFISDGDVVSLNFNVYGSLRAR